MYQRDEKSQPDSAPDFRLPHSCCFCSERRKEAKNQELSAKNLKFETVKMAEVFLTSREPFSQLQIVRVGFRPARTLSVSWPILNSAGVVSTRTEDICEARLISHTHAHTHLGNITSTLYRFSTCLVPFFSRDTLRFCIQNRYSVSRVGRVALKPTSDGRDVVNSVFCILLRER